MELWLANSEISQLKLNKKYSIASQVIHQDVNIKYSGYWCKLGLKVMLKFYYVNKLSVCVKLKYSESSAKFGGKNSVAICSSILFKRKTLLFIILMNKNIFSSVLSSLDLEFLKEGWRKTDNVP